MVLVVVQLGLDSTTALPRRTQTHLHMSNPASLAGDGSCEPNEVLLFISILTNISIMQGILTCAVAIVGVVLIVDFPELSTNTTFVKFLNEKEAAFVVSRIERDRHDVNVEEAFNVRRYLANALDLKVWGFAGIFGLATISLYAIAYFLPIILRDGMGFDIAASQCLTAPPYVAAAIVMFVFAYFGDKYHIRGPFVISCALCGLIGLPLLDFYKNVGVRYFGVFLAVIAGNSIIPCIMSHDMASE
jgi:hypothetical protein